MERNYDYPIGLALITVGTEYKIEIPTESRKKIKEFVKYRLNDFYGDYKPKPDIKLTETERHIVNIVTDLVIEFFEIKEEERKWIKEL